MRVIMTPLQPISVPHTLSKPIASSPRGTWAVQNSAEKKGSASAPRLKLWSLFDQKRGSIVP